MSKDLPKNTEIIGRDQSGRFTEGNKGKPKGATNTTTRELREFITNFLNDKAFEIPHIWNSLEDKDKASLYLHLCRLVMPKTSPEPNIDTKESINPIRFIFSGEDSELTTEQEYRYIELLQLEQTDNPEFMKLFSMLSMEQFREIIKKPILNSNQIDKLIEKL
jgi:hypothetical protein